MKDIVEGGWVALLRLGFKHWYGMLWYGFLGLICYTQKATAGGNSNSQKGQSKLPPYKLRDRINFSRYKRICCIPSNCPEKGVKQSQPPPPQKEVGVQVYPIPGMGDENNFMET